MADNDGDDALRARFNALRQSSAPTSPPQSSFQSESQSAADELESRFRRLGTPKRDDLDIYPSTGDDVKDIKEEEVEVEALLKDIDANEKAAHQDVESSKPLMEEAERILKEHREAEAKEAGGKDEESIAEDTKDEAEIVNSALDDAELEKKHDDESKSQESNKVEDSSEEENEEDEEGGDELDSLIKLPSVPNAAPSAKDIEADDNDIAARLAALSLPTTLKPQPSSTDAGPKLPDIPDEEIESWCIICCDDAIVRCLGCDGDLYCMDCWNEGHRSPEAGPEERKHRALAYTKPTGKKKDQKRRVVA